MMSLDFFIQTSMKDKLNFPKTNPQNILTGLSDLHYDQIQKAENATELLKKKTLYSYKSYSSKNEAFYCCRFDPEDKMIAAGNSKQIKIS